jgi:hypothetical protein
VPRLVLWRKRDYYDKLFFQKRDYRKWTWMSLGSVTRNEIDFSMSKKKQIFNDISVIIAVKT